MLSSFSNILVSNMLGVCVLRTIAGCDGRMPYFSGLLVYWLGRLQDSNSASSSGVTARSEKPRIFFLDRLAQKRAKVTARSSTRVPMTTAKMIQTFLSIILTTGGGRE